MQLKTAQCPLHIYTSWNLTASGHGWLTILSAWQCFPLTAPEAPSLCKEFGRGCCRLATPHQAAGGWCHIVYVYMYFYFFIPSSSSAAFPLLSLFSPLGWCGHYHVLFLSSYNVSKDNAAVTSVCLC